MARRPARSSDLRLPREGVRPARGVCATLASVRFAFVMPYGEPSDGFFSDTLLSLLCADARAAGHEANMLRVYYDGRDPRADDAVRAQLEAWLAERDVDVTVVERLFDPAPLLSHKRAAAGRTLVQVTRGDSLEPADGVDYVLGALPGLTRRGTTRRTPTTDELRQAFGALIERAATLSAAWRQVPGLTRVIADGLASGAPLVSAVAAPPTERRRFLPVLEQAAIAPSAPPPVVRKTLLGNVGCPYSADPLELPHYAGVMVPDAREVARLGCAFCHMGGDYEKRADAEVIADLIEQAQTFVRGVPELEELVLSDQHPIRYLEGLMDAAARAKLPSLRWLFPARADDFLRERAKIEAAARAAARAGQRLELYLSGFEAFCDRELLRYGKGTTRSELIAAVHAMREVRARHAGAFDMTRARGHSLLLWNPWTTIDDVQESLDALRSEGMAELFHDIGRNRLRLYADLPITWAAERDGAVTAEWEDGDEGAGRRKGYSTELPWRFLHATTRTAHAAAAALRDRLGRETELAQLAAAVDYARRHERGDVAAVMAALDRLDATVARFSAAKRAAGEPERCAATDASVVLLSGACNNGCAACPNRDTWLEDGEGAMLGRVEAALAAGRPLLIAGREPTLHDALLPALERARERGLPAGVVSNGRRFAYAAFTERAVRAGLTGASVKLFAPTAGVADAIARAPGAQEQALEGARQLRVAGVALEVRAPLHRENVNEYATMAACAEAAGAAGVRVEIALDALGLDRLADGARAIDGLAAECARRGLGFDVAPLAVGTRDFRFLPAYPPSGMGIAPSGSGGSGRLR